MTKKRLFTSVLVAWATLSQPAQAQQSISVEERFQDVFLTAGYCTAFGAALGTAMLAWTEEPTENLKFVAIGASLGFISGSILGTYVVLAPMASVRDDGEALQTNSNHPRPVKANIIGSRDLATGSASPFVISPILDSKTYDLVAIQGSYTVLRF